MRKRLFIDMDGTIARFHDEENYLERMYEPGFFESLRPFKEMVQAVKLFIRCNPRTEVYILSSLINSPFCEIEKRRWLSKYLPEVRNICLVPEGVDKSDFIGRISALDVLLDDYNKNLFSWKRSGGRAIKLINNINNRGLVGEKWGEESVVYNSLPFVICHQLNSFYEYAQMDFADLMPSVESLPAAIPTIPTTMQNAPVVTPA